MYVGGIDLMRAPITLNEHGHGDRYKDHMESSTERYHVVPGHIVLIKQPQCWGGRGGSRRGFQREGGEGVVSCVTKLCN